MKAFKEPVLSVSGLATTVDALRGETRVLDGVSIDLLAGETLGLVGESGSGKTMTGLALMGLLPDGGAIQAGSIRFADRELAGLDEPSYRALRGSEIAMVFQDSMTSLNPTRPIGVQVAEPLRLHQGVSRRAAMRRVEEMLDLVGIPAPRERLDDYPHQLSGGMRQRVMIAMALMCDPKVLIADEPTTALDVTIQNQILTLLDRIKDRLNMAALLVTHDLGVIAQHADRVCVLYAGRVAEIADTDDLVSDMRHPYTQALFGAVPAFDQDRTKDLYSIPGSPPDLSRRGVGCPFAPRCAHATEQCSAVQPPLDEVSPGHAAACWHQIRGPWQPTRRAYVTDAVDRPTAVDGHAGQDPEPLMAVDRVVKEFAGGQKTALGGKTGTVHAVSDVSFDVLPGETFGLVGESGSGKTTLGRIIAGLEPLTSGSVAFGASRIDRVSDTYPRHVRRHIQMIFQDSYEALDPHLTIGEILREPLRIQRIGSASDQRTHVRELLDDVGLSSRAVERRPHELSGGQRQRVGIARALALRPQVIVADEPVSALDASVQSQVLNLMRALQREYHLTYVMISHDLTVVRYLADRIGVMYLGKLVELGSGETLYQRPAHPYTAGLISAIPGVGSMRQSATDGASIEGDVPSSLNPPSGCRFRTRCPFAQGRCAVEEPPLLPRRDGHLAACHFPLTD